MAFKTTCFNLLPRLAAFLAAIFGQSSQGASRARLSAVGVTFAQSNESGAERQRP